MVQVDGSRSGGAGSSFSLGFSFLEEFTFSVQFFSVKISLVFGKVFFFAQPFVQLFLNRSLDLLGGAHQLLRFQHDFMLLRTGFRTGLRFRF